MANLRDFMAAPDRFEHHLVIVARAGDAVLECATASEPLAFAHANISDEYALMLPSGDPMVDAFQARTFVTDKTGRDVGRVKHGVGDLVLHPHGYLHWPGRLRPPYEPFRFAPGMRKRGLSLVACAARPTPPGERPLGATPGREDDLKGDVPMSLVDTRRAAPGVVGVVADALLELVAAPPPHEHGWLLDLDSCELHRLPAELPGLRRGLLFHSPTGGAADPPPIPAAPFAPFEDAPAGGLPFSQAGLAARALSDSVVVVAAGGAHTEVPRHWLARLLFRLALHGYRLGRVETYGGLSIDDTGPDLTVRVPGGAAIRVPRAVVEPLYRAVAPPGYEERTAVSAARTS